MRLHNSILLIKELYRRNNVLFYLAILLASLFLIFLSTFTLCQSPLHKICFWLKPCKFSLSFAIYAATLGWYLEYLKIAMGERWIKCLSWLISILILIEMGIILIQSLLTSNILQNFHMSASLNRNLYLSALITIIINIVVCAYIALKFFTMQTTISSVSYLWGIRAGFIIFILSGILGVLLIALYGQSAPNPNYYGIPLITFSSIKDNLISLHFIGIHSLQFLPLCCYFFQRNIGRIFALSSVSLYAVACLFVVFKIYN